MSHESDLEPEVRFWKRVTKTPTCWLWQGRPNSKGYGRLRVGAGESMYAHRFSYELHVGSVPTGLSVLHKCDVPLCVNPEHLFLGTRGDNNRDRDAKGRTLAGEAHGSARLTTNDVREIYAARRAGSKIVTLAKRYGVSAAHLTNVLKGKRWRQALARRA